jgi:hypothetical protein
MLKKIVHPHKAVKYIEVDRQRHNARRYFPELGPPPHHLGCVAPPNFGSMRETLSLAVEGVGGPNSDEGTDTKYTYSYSKALRLYRGGKVGTHCF